MRGGSPQSGQEKASDSRINREAQCSNKGSSKQAEGIARALNWLKDRAYQMVAVGTYD